MTDLVSPRPISRIVRAFERFARIESSSGILLVAAAAVALVWANTRWHDAYRALWDTRMGVTIGGFGLSMDLLHWINEGLMAIFFFLVGLEIKREVMTGELSDRRRAVLPMAAALGGMVVPALLYLAIAGRTDAARGWGVPMATDIAFVLGVLSLLGTRAPAALKVFLTALAIIDDLAAVLVIALFYTSGIDALGLVGAAALLGLLIAANRAGIRRPGVYAVLAVGVWSGFLLAGVHATVAGVLAALTIPARPRLGSREFVEAGRQLMDAYESAPGDDDSDALQSLESAIGDVASPLQRMEHALQAPVAYGIVPLFALANAGVAVDAAGLQIVEGAAVSVGLLVGKPVGIVSASWLALRAGVAALPEGVAWRQLVGAGVMAGMGFTMSLFIAGLALPPGPVLDTAKLAVLTASAVAGAVGYLVVRRAAAVGE